MRLSNEAPNYSQEMRDRRWGVSREFYFKWVNRIRKYFYHRRVERKIIIQYISDLNPQTILDYGCADGLNSSIYREKIGATVYGTDLDTGAIEHGQAHYPNVNFIPLDDLEKIDVKFDVITASHVLEHVADVEKTVALFYKLLIPGGKMILTVPQERFRGDTILYEIFLTLIFHFKWINPHVRRVTKRTLNAMLEPYRMEVIKYKYVNLLPPFKSNNLIWPYAWSLVAVCGSL